MNWKHVWFQLSGNRLAKGCDWFGDHPLVKQCSTGQITLKTAGVVLCLSCWELATQMGTPVTGCQPEDLSCVLDDTSSLESTLWREEHATLTLAFSGYQSNPFMQFSSKKVRLYFISRLLCGCSLNLYQLKAGIVTLAIGWLSAVYYFRKFHLCLKSLFYSLLFPSGSRLFKQNYCQDSKHLCTLSVLF